MSSSSALDRALDAQIVSARALQCEFVLWPEAEPFEDDASGSWRSTIDPRFDEVRRALGRAISRCSMTLEDGAGRLHVWAPRAEFVRDAPIVQRIAEDARMQCLVCDDGEWSRRVTTGDRASMTTAIQRLFRGTTDWVVLEGGPDDALFVQIGPRTLADTVLVELVSNRFLSAALAHRTATLRQLTLLQWRAPNGYTSTLHHCERSVRSAESREALVDWVWRSWDVAFSMHAIRELRLRTLAS